MSRRIIASLCLSTLLLTGLAGAAEATTTTPSTIYYPSVAQQSGCATGSLGQQFVDASGTPIAQVGSLTGANGDQITITNGCNITIYIGYDGGPNYTALAAGATGTYTLANNATIVSAYTGATFGGSTSTLAVIYVLAPVDVTTGGSNSATSLSPSSLPSSKSLFTMKNGGSNQLTITGPISTGGPFPCNPCTLMPGGTGNYTVIGAGGNVQVGSATLSVGTAGGGGAGGGSASGVPAPVIQEFGLPVAVTCDASASKDLNWAGVASGGWAVSWGQWMNGGKGGAVCTRTLVYSTAQAKWTVAA